MSLPDQLNVMWPLVFLLVALLVLRHLRDEVKPVFSSIVGGLSKNAASNATQYAIALGFGLSASMSAFYDVFSTLGRTDLAALSWHQYFALWTKVGNPFIVAVLAYATQSTPKKADGTKPPFSAPTS